MSSFRPKTKFIDLDLDFSLQWTHTDIDFSLFTFTPLIAWLCALLRRPVGIDELFPTNTKFIDLDLDFTHSDIEFSLFQL